jgi:hypothetical protein
MLIEPFAKTPQTDIVCTIMSCYSARSMIIDLENTRSIPNVLPLFAVYKAWVRDYLNIFPSFGDKTNNY